MKRLIATIILGIIAITIAGCDFTYHHVGHYPGHGHPRAIIVTRPPVYYPPPAPPHWHGHHSGRHWRGH